MAFDSLLFFVDDDSPSLAYYPQTDYSPEPDYSAAWSLLYSLSGSASAPGQIGNGSSYHITSLDGATLQIQWNGTGIDLIGSVANASLQLSLDGQLTSTPANSTSLPSFSGLQNTNHSLLLTVTNTTTSPDSYFIFNNALVHYGAPPAVQNSTPNSLTINDSDIAFLGHWSYFTDTTGTSMHISSTPGDRASVAFQGSALTLYGLISAYSGEYAVTVDNSTVLLTALSSYNNSNALLYYATDLQDTSHLLTVTNMANSTFAIRVGGLNVTAFGDVSPAAPTQFSSSTSTPRGTIAALVLAGVIILLLLAGALYYFAIARPRHRRRRQEQAKLCDRRHVEKRDIAPHDVIDICPDHDDLEDMSLSTSKGYGFGLGITRGFFRKKEGSHSSSSKSPKSGTSATARPPVVRSEQTQFDDDDDDDKYIPSPTLAEHNLPTLPHSIPHAYASSPEPEKLAPGRNAHHRRSLSPTRVPGHQRVGSDGLLLEEQEDGDTRSSRRGSRLAAATLTLSPRTSEAPLSFGAAIRQSMFNSGYRRESVVSRDKRFLQVRDTSPFRVDVGAILGSKRSSKATRRTSDSASQSTPVIDISSSQNPQAHQPTADSQRDGDHIDQGTRSIPLVVLENKLIEVPSTPTGYSFLDFTSSTASSVHRQSKGTTASTYEHKHDRDDSRWSYNTTTDRAYDSNDNNNDSLRQDAPISVSHGGSPKSSASRLSSSPPTTHGSSPFPFPITIPPSPHLPHPYNAATPPSRQPPPIGHTYTPRSSKRLHPTHPPPVAVHSNPASPTDSVPFSVSDIHFRHSDSEDAGPGSRPTSTGSHLPPHPPLPNRDGSQPSTPASAPPPYIVQRVLGMTPIIPPTPSRLQSPMQSSFAPVRPPSPSGSSSPPPLSPFVAPFRIGSLLGPRPRPSTAGSSSRDLSSDTIVRSRGGPR